MKVAELVQGTLKSGVDQNEFLKFITAHNQKYLYTVGGFVSQNIMHNGNDICNLTIFKDEQSRQNALKLMQEYINHSIEGFNDKKLFDYIDMSTVKVTQYGVDTTYSI